MSCQIRQKRPAPAQRAKIVMCGHSQGEICVLPPENTCHFGSALTELRGVHVNQSGKTTKKMLVCIEAKQYKVYDDATTCHEYKEPC